MKDKPFDIFLKAMAFLVPIYFVFYSPLHENSDSPKTKSLWKYIYGGFVTYLFFAIIISIL